MSLVTTAVATLRALAATAAVTIGRDELPALALAVETQDLGIAAGLQGVT